MEKSDQHRDVSTTSTNGVATDIAPLRTKVQPQADAARADSEAKKEKIPRTPGLKLFDVFLYPVLTNGAVFAISVAATYLTTRGGNRDANGKLVYSKIGEFMFNRGEWLKNKFSYRTFMKKVNLPA
jgi:hypothetical protein